MTIKLRPAHEVAAEILAADPLKEFFTPWDEVTQDDHDALIQAMDGAAREEDMQRFLKLHPACLIQHLGGGHGRWVIPKPRLGAEYVPDFLIAEKHSFGFEWQAVELESPLHPMFNKNGDPSRALNHAIRQIEDWRAWLKSNQAYASRKRSEGGLGLTDIDMNVRGLILIGRRSQAAEATSERRRQMVQRLNIQIHTYDYLSSSLAGRLASFRPWTDSPS